VAVGLVGLAVLGFGFGMIAGALWEEPALVASFLAGDAEVVAWGSERALPRVGAAADDLAESGSSEAAASEDPAPQPTAAVDFAPQPTAAVDFAPQPTGAAGFAVQVGAFADGDAAARLADSLRAKGYAVYVVAGTGAGASRWRVRVGPLASREEAEGAATRLKRDETLPTWVLDEEQQ
jgi:DedD protein